MRIEAFGALVAVVWLTAVLSTRLLVAASNDTTESLTHKPISSSSSSSSSSSNSGNSGNSREPHFGEHYSNRWTMSLEESTTRRLSYPEMQELIRLESGANENPVDCCPTVMEMIEPAGGINQNNMYVELYRHKENKQRFYEVSCKEEFLDKPCRFIDRKLAPQSRCVQKFTFVYAIIKSNAHSKEDEEPRVRHNHHQHGSAEQYRFQGFPVGTTPWALDYIKVRSGCSCEIYPKPRKRKTAAMKLKKSRVLSSAPSNRTRLLSARIPPHTHHHHHHNASFLPATSIENVSGGTSNNSNNSNESSSDSFELV
ncbi:uncharacterized protein LOC106650740 [Trichogramma pretiosum]|uniref:uncharacterized protein LOC106650740 n=1 Tax=Trichogramma pretiosum TaxID=7493 RepID=UPI0006C9C0E3|nr:uncharacterized protein LOC106650740 [Trichogramma pretiosum]XP_014224411.1 uncharacterized protein LOC106650740 [Trichogramma pretiosum]XP_023317792.1 uncharacterized protein LOC106650740 [Trichogramma pretiosum]XP_023317793.1 uncharacterized protein LOC106650740 [Trichogramma pretiosum]